MLSSLNCERVCVDGPLGSLAARGTKADAMVPWSGWLGGWVAAGWVAGWPGLLAMVGCGQ